MLTETDKEIAELKLQLEEKNAVIQQQQELIEVRIVCTGHVRVLRCPF